MKPFSTVVIAAVLVACPALAVAQSSPYFSQADVAAANKAMNDRQAKEAGKPVPQPPSAPRVAAPVAREGEQKVRVAQRTSQPTSQSLASYEAQQPASAGGRELDLAVRDAIARKDLGHARNLALTPAHWQWIKAAEAGPPKTEANLRWEQLNSQQCKQAQRSHDIAVASILNDYAEIQRKREAERQVCGGYIKAR